MFKSFICIFGFICVIYPLRETGIQGLDGNRENRVNGRLYTGIGANTTSGVGHQYQREEEIMKIINNLPKINGSFKEIREKISNVAKSIENNHSIILSDIQMKIRCLSIEYRLKNLDSSIIYLANSNDIERLAQIKRLDSDFESLKRGCEELERQINASTENSSQPEYRREEGRSHKVENGNQAELGVLESNAEKRESNVDGELQNQINPSNIPPSGGSESTAQELGSTEAENNGQDSRNRLLNSLKTLLSQIKENIGYGNNLLELAIKMNREGLPDRIRNDFSNNPVDSNYYKAATVFSDQREFLEFLENIVKNSHQRDFLEFLENIIEKDEFESL